MDYKTLTPKEAALVTAYKAFNYNGTKAWLAVKPTSKYNAARASAARLLKKPEIQAALQELNQDVNKTIAYTKKELHKDTSRIMKLAEEEKQLSAAVKCVELKARTERLFDDDTDDSSKYTMFIQQITNNNINITKPIQNTKELNNIQEVLCVELLDSTQSEQITTETIVE